MEILVISDSHRRTGVIDKILSSHKEIAYVFFLGDNVGDIEDFDILYPEKRFFAVSGNCDFASTVPSVGLENIAGKNILYTHGHNFDVKYGIERLKDVAQQRGCDIVLYGHTHISNVVYDDGLYIVNPGSCSQPRDGSRPSYCVIDIVDGGIMPRIIEI